MMHFMCVKHYKLRGSKSLREGILRLKPSLKHSVPYTRKYMFRSNCTAIPLFFDKVLSTADTINTRKKMYLHFGAVWP